MTTPPASSITAYFSGRTLVAARIVGAAIVVFSLLVLIIAIPPYHVHLQSLFSPQIFQQLHLPVTFFAWYVVLIELAFEMFFVIIAGVIFWRRSHDPMALFIAVMLVLLGVNFPFALSILERVQPAWHWPVSILDMLALLSAFIALFIFPDFRFVPSQMRWWAVAGGMWLIASYSIEYPPSIIGKLAFFFFDLACFASGAWAQIYRYRKSANALQRQQTKWIVFGLSIAIASILFDLPKILYPDNLRTLPGLLYNMFYVPARLLFMALIPLSIAFSILRYRLWNIDFVINRSLVYGALTVLLLALFGGSLFIISLLFQNFAGGPLVAVAVSAAIFGAIFQPTRRRLQRFIDQRFYNIQIDYQKTPHLGPQGLTASLPHTQLGEYRNLELIGRGGMAEVYKGIHPTLGLPVAIKILSAALSADPDFRHRFEREARVIAGLQHPNIVRLLDSGTESETPYIVLEYLAGKDLGAYLHQNGKLSIDEARGLLEGIAAALDYAHASGLVHRDIKPSNVILDAGRAVLSDFGISKLLGAQTSITNTGILGTLDYIAPEQIQASAQVDGRADIYALGVMAFQMLTGELPFRHNNPGALLIAHLTQPPPNPKEIVPSLSSAVTVAIWRALAKHPDERYATAGEFVVALGM
jgi:serine/threonine-protein kinase